MGTVVTLARAQQLSKRTHGLAFHRPCLPLFSIPPPCRLSVSGSVAPAFPSPSGTGLWPAGVPAAAPRTNSGLCVFVCLLTLNQNLLEAWQRGWEVPTSQLGSSPGGCLRTLGGFCRPQTTPCRSQLWGTVAPPSSLCPLCLCGADGPSDIGTLVPCSQPASFL